MTTATPINWPRHLTPVKTLRHLGVDATWLAPRIWIGSLPPIGSKLHDLGFNALVLCAAEFQPAANLWPGLTVIRAPFDDDGSVPVGRETWAIASYAARQAVSEHARGARVLITCRAGLNRSGLVSALTLKGLIPSRDMTEIVRHIQDTRWVESDHEEGVGAHISALFNKRFVEALLAGGEFRGAVHIRRRQG